MCFFLCISIILIITLSCKVFICFQDYFSGLALFLHRIDPEEAHLITLKMLKFISPFLSSAQYPCRPVFKMGLEFPSLLGSAAGFDKNAEVVDALFKIGFGFVEIGTVTPLPQIGNPKPRLFRLVEDGAVINRMGFNNDGAEIVSKRLKKRLNKGKKGIVGVNIGANKDSDNRIHDYAVCAKAFLDVASYFTINISSPNTMGLRNLQQSQYLVPLLEGVLNVTQGKKPILLKIAPDLLHEDLEDIAETVNHLPIAGVVTTNTTVSRPALYSEHSGQTGGLSGKPLYDLSTCVAEVMRRLLLHDKIIVGVGGIDSVITAKGKLEVGADLIQLYSALVFKGPDLIKQINQKLISS